MDLEGDTIVVQKRRLDPCTQHQEDSDDEPLAFNSRRSTTIDFDPESDLTDTSSSPEQKQSSSSVLDITYTVDVLTGRLVDILPANSTTDDRISPRSAFAARRDRLVKMLPSENSTNFSVELPIRGSSVTPNSFDNVLPASSDIQDTDLWEGDSLDGCIVESDSDSADTPRPRKHRKKVQIVDIDEVLNRDQEPGETYDSGYESRAATESGSNNMRDKLRRLLHQIEDAEDLKLLYPESLQPVTTAQFDQPYVYSEDEALQFLSSERRRISDYVELELTSFSIYCTPNTSDRRSKFPGQLEHLMTATKGKELCLIDGQIKDQYQQSCKVEGMTLDRVIITNLDDPSTVSTEGKICLVSRLSGVRNIRYRLSKPACGYDAYFQSFRWLADFTKLVFHYLAAQSHMGRIVHLSDFAAHFWNFINDYGWGENQFKVDNWHSLCGGVRDFRKHIIRYGDFVREQAVNTKRTGLFDILFEHDVWDEVGLSEIKLKQSKPKSGPTIVTSTIGKSFLESFPSWGKAKHDLLKLVDPTHDVKKACEDRCNLLGFANKMKADQTGNFVARNGKRIPKTVWKLEEARRSRCRSLLSATDMVGKVIIVRRGNAYRYAYVRAMVDDNRVKIIWLLHAGDTTCGGPSDGAFYPVGNELFFSDECSCRSMYCSDAIAVYGVSLFAEKARDGADFLINMLFRTADQAFVTISRQTISDCLGCKRTTHSHAAAGNQSQGNLEIISLFSGAGLLDHAIASVGGFQTKLAVEIDGTALLSHKANTPNDCDHVCMSTNDYLAEVISGRRPYRSYHCLVAGCPCQGFSGRNPNKTSEKSQRNCSMLANTLSYVDIFRPEFVIIENVKLMDHANSASGKANACAQAISCLVSMSYQVRKMVLKGNDYNAATSRSRLFIVAAAPGLELPAVPPIINGTNSAYSALDDLDEVHNDLTVNIKRPDHVPFGRLGIEQVAEVSLRNVVKRVPLVKKSVKVDQRSLFGAWDRGLLSRHQERWFFSLTEEKQRPSSGSLRRVDPEGHFPTITCQYVPLDSRGGAFIHPHQHRVVTCEELRRAQGVPDDFILIGDTEAAIHQVGNGVVWQVAQALGRSVKQAWLASQSVSTTDDNTDHDNSELLRIQAKNPTTPKREILTPSRRRDLSFSGGSISRSQDRKGTPSSSPFSTTRKTLNPYTLPPIVPQTPPKQFRDPGGALGSSRSISGALKRGTPSKPNDHETVDDDDELVFLSERKADQATQERYDRSAKKQRLNFGWSFN